MVISVTLVTNTRPQGSWPDVSPKAALTQVTDWCRGGGPLAKELFSYSVPPPNCFGVLNNEKLLSILILTFEGSMD